MTELVPSPAKPPPIWTGSLGPKSLAVTGRAADGWIPGHAADWLSERFVRSRPIIDEAAAAVGRPPSAIKTIFNVPGSITATPRSTARDGARRWIGGSVQQWADELTSAVREHGAGGFVYFPAGEESSHNAAIGRWATEVVPSVREALRHA